jgi:hypothetical protein
VEGSHYAAVYEVEGRISLALSWGMNWGLRVVRDGSCGSSEPFGWGSFTYCEMR